MQRKIEKKLDAFFSQYSKVEYKLGEIIIQPQEPIDHIYYLKQGFVRQYYITSDEEDITHHIFKPISYFPMMLVLSNTPNTYTFEAMENLDLIKAPTGKVMKFLKQEPDVLLDLTQRLSQGLTKILVRNEHTLFKNSYAKVVLLLTYLGKRFGTPGEKHRVVSLPIHHADLASWLGLETETVLKQIKKLQKKGLIGYNEIIIVIEDIDQLEQEAVNSSTI